MSEEELDFWIKSFERKIPFDFGGGDFFFFNELKTTCLFYCFFKKMSYGLGCQNKHSVLFVTSCCML